jgi:hypothetical protein
MAEGALTNGVCYGSQDAARDAYYSHAPAGQTPGVTSFLSTFEKVSGSWVMRRYQVDQSGQVFTMVDAAAPLVAFPVCDPLESFKDGQMLGWGVVAAMAVAFCIVVLKRGI